MVPADNLAKRVNGTDNFGPVATLITGAGEQFVGEPIGASAEVAGPLAICTAAQSPLAQLSQPEYDGAIVVFTTPHIGARAEDLDQIVAAGIVVREPALGDASRGSESLDAILKAAGIPGVAGVDTRQITQLVAAANGPLTAEIKQY